MVSCCQKALLCQECVLKVQNLLKKFLHPRFPVANSQEKVVIEWCSNRNSLSWCCQRGTQKRNPWPVTQFWSLHLLHIPGTHLCVGIFGFIYGVVPFLPGSFLCVPAVAVMCNHPRDDPLLFQAPAELGRSHRAAVWPQLWEGICWLLLCPQ